VTDNGQWNSASREGGGYCKEMDAGTRPHSLWESFESRARQARPLLKWAGGKQRFIQIYSRHLPNFTGKYIEPFLGGGSVFFHMTRTQERPFVARLGDVNRHLIRCYASIRDDPEGVSDRLEILQAGYTAAKDKGAFYYDLRAGFTQRHPNTDAAEFVFLNRTCWNGLWRVNSDGHFNVPYGAPKTDNVIPGREEVLNVAVALQGAFLRATPWQHTVAFAEPGDFVFLDPPYFSETLLGRDSYSDKYQKKVFGLGEHERLARALRDLADRGIDFALTNSAEPEMEQLYRSLGLNIRHIELPRNINSKTDSRQGVSELMVTPGPAPDFADQQGAVLLDLDAIMWKARRQSRSE
jgi:DNA adenine methylase